MSQRQSSHRKPLRPRTGRAAVAVLAATALVSAVATSSAGLVRPGTPGKDVTVGLDNDNADNVFIQPRGVSVPQHMDNADVLFGRANDDLLIGRLGADTLLGGRNDDILIGGPDDTASPSSDVLVGDEGRDISIWSPGDGNDAFVANDGSDTMIFAPIVTKSNGAILRTRHDGRQVPRVVIDRQPDYTCTIVTVPARERLGSQFLVRFLVGGEVVATVRQKDVERVLCPSPARGRAELADLTARRPHFREVRLNRVPGTVGRILAPVGGGLV